MTSRMFKKGGLLKLNRKHKKKKRDSAKQNPLDFTADRGEPSYYADQLVEHELIPIRKHVKVAFKQAERFVPEKDIKVLKAEKKLHWSNVLIQLILVQDNTIWRVFLLFLLMLNYFLKMYEISFIKSHRSDLLLTIELLTDVVFFLNFVFSLTIFLWKKLHLLVTNTKSTRNQLILDGLVVIPYDLLYVITTREAKISGTYLVLVLISFFRLYHVQTFFNDKSNQAGVKHFQYFVAGYLNYLLIFNHTASCLLFLLICPFECKLPTGWGYVVKSEVPYWKWYIYSSYFSLMTITNSGFGEFLSTDMTERAIISCTMTGGFLLTTLVLIGALSSDIMTKVARISDLRIQITALKNHFKRIGLSAKDSIQIKNYYDILWAKKRGIKESKALNWLPLPLRREIAVDINFYLLQYSLLFRNQSESFVRELSLLMKHEFFQPGEIIFPNNMVKYKMICVACGTIEILSDEDYESPIISFSKGTVLGEAALILTLPSRTIVRAANYCELQVLYRKDFSQIINLYPSTYQEIRNQVLERIANYRKDLEIGDIKLERSNKLSLYVSQKIHYTAIKRVKKRLLEEPFDDVVPASHHVCEMYKLSDNIKVKKGKYIVASNDFPCILYPDTSFTRFWDTLLFFDVLIIGLIYPYCISFLRSFPPLFQKLAIILETFYAIDFYIILFTIVEEKDRVIKSWTEIFKWQLRRWTFYLDLLSTLPIELFFWHLSDRYYYMAKINRVLKWYKVPMFFRKFEDILQTNILAVRITKYIIYIIYINYWFGILMFFNTCFKSYCAEDGWYRTHLKKDQELKLATPCSSHKVLMSFYLGMTCLSTVGFDDISPGNISDMLLMMFGCVLGIFLFGYCISELSATITYNIKPKTEFQLSLFTLKSFLQSNRIEQSIQDRVLKFIELQWYYNEAADLTSLSMLRNATVHIQNKITYHEMVSLLSKHPMYRDTDLEFIKLVAAGCRSVVLPPDEYLTHVGSSSRELYIIHKGYCKRMEEQKVDGNVIVEILGPGDSFGTQNIIMGREIACQIKTITHVKVIVIAYSTFYSSISIFPHLLNQIEAALPEEYLHASSTGHTGDLDDNDDDVELQLPEQDKRWGTVKFFHWFMKEMQESFIYVPAYCEQNGEDYEEVFAELKYFQIFKYLLLPICIVPQGLFLKMWVTMRLTQVILIALLIPYQQVLAPYAPNLDFVMVALDLIAYFDLYLMLFVGYYGSQNQLIFHPCKTAINYLKGTFMLDFFVCFPWEILLCTIVPEHNEGHSDYAHSLSPHIFHCCLRILRIAQIYRLPGLFLYLETDVIHSGLKLQVLKFVLTILLITNFWAAVFIYTTCKYYHISDLNINMTINSIGEPPGMGPKKINEYTIFCKKDSWIERSHFQEYSDPHSIYIMAWYFVGALMVLSGFGDFTAQDQLQLIMVNILILLGTFSFGFIFAYTASYTTDLNSHFSKYQGMMAELLKYFQNEKVTEQIQKLTLSNAAFRWNRNFGREPNKILSCVHSALHEDAVLNLYERTLRQVALFENVNRSFFRILGKALKERCYTKGSNIFNADDVIDMIFIVHQGKIEVTFYQNFYDVMLTYMGNGAIIGNITNNVKSRMLSSVIAVTNLDVLWIKTEEFYRILKRYPKVKIKFERSLNRQDHKEFCAPLNIPLNFNLSIHDHANSDSSISSDEIEIVTSEESVSDSLRISHKAKQGTRTKIKKTIIQESENVISTNMGTLILIFWPKKWFKASILPETKILHIIGLICIFCAYLNTILVTYQFAFQDFHTILLIIQILVDVIFCWNMFLELHTAFLNRYNDYIIKNSKIRRRYFSDKKRRLIDFIANVPYPYMAFLLRVMFKKDPLTTFSVLKLFSVLRLRYIYDSFRRLSTNVMGTSLVLKLVSLFIWVSIMLHIFSCVWYLIACPIYFCVERSWVKIFYERERSAYEIYLICIYFITGCATDTGIGDIRPKSILEILYLIVLMFVVKFLIGIFLGIATNMMDEHASFLKRYEGDIYELRDYLQNENLSNHQMDKMWNYVKQLWARSNGVQLPKIVDGSISYTNVCILKYDVYGHQLRDTFLFIGIEPTILKQICYYIQPLMFFPGNYIVQHGDSDQCMYLIHRGEVDVLTVHHNLTETIHDTLHAGELFGVPQGLFFGVCHHFSFRAKTTVDVGVLRLKDWQELMVLFPSSKDMIYKRATATYNKV